MALEDVLRSLAEHWDDVLARLGDADRGELIELVTTINAGGDDAEDAIFEVTPLLLRTLPADHPVRLATRSGIRLHSGTLALPGPLLAQLAALPGLALPSAAEIWAQSRRRLLQAPSVSPAALRSTGQDPELPTLIRLEDDDGSILIPRFQLDPDGVPLPVVLRVNAVLDVLDDPWGAADWWLGENAWLQQAPADLIGVVSDDVLIATAASMAED